MLHPNNHNIDVGIADPITIFVDQVGLPVITGITVLEGELGDTITFVYKIYNIDAATVDQNIENSVDDSASWLSAATDGATDIEDAYYEY